MNQTNRHWIAVVLVCCVSRFCVSAEPSHDQLLFFENNVRPALATRCFRCHGANKQKGGLRLDSLVAVKSGGDLGPAISLHDPSESILLHAISYQDADFQMPPDGKLPEADIAAIRKWIELGAPWPNAENHPTVGEGEDEFPTSTDHWSFQPIANPPVPVVENAAWCSNAFDRFVLRAIERRGLQVSERATPRQLVRRVYFDLTGLPPSYEAVVAFDANPSAAAYEALVDRLLASPQYGERWGRHWLDVVRYAETNGIAGDKKKENAWRYRDYVIQSFNDDKPYDRFLWEQLAGDELPDVTPATVIATGFYRLALYQKLGEQRQLKLKRLEKFIQLDDMARAISEGMLGVTMGCARCHDHKFDPISQRDYYSLLAFFNNVVPIDQDQPVPLVDVQRYESKHEDQKELRNSIGKLRKQSERLKAKASDELVRKRLTADEWKQYLAARELDFRKRSAEQSRFFERVENDLLPDLDEIHAWLDNAAEWTALQDELEQAESNLFPTALAVREFGATPEPMHLLVRGDIDSPRELCPPVFPTVLSWLGEHTVCASTPGHDPKNCTLCNRTATENSLASSLRRSRGETSGQRTRLAAWIASPKNPLTSRVIVNRVLQYHFGEGIVKTPNDFGAMGMPPTNPELLDWLATWFVNNGSSIKKLHKLILLSSTYQQSSKFQDSQSEENDPNNDLWRRQNLRRLEAESIRDSILLVSSELNPTMGGESFYPSMSRGMITLAKGSWGKSGRRDRSRRSVYTFVKRTLKTPFLELFDYNNYDQSVGRRNVSTVAPQALLLLNSQFINRQTTSFAGRLIETAGRNPDNLVRHAFRVALQRDPREEEMAACVELIDADEVTDEESQAVALIVLNLNEFIYMD